MQFSPDTLTVTEWANDGSLKVVSQRNRQKMIRQLERANANTIKQLLDDIQQDRVTLYQVSKRFIDSIRDRAPWTVYQLRSMLPGMWESVLGEANFSRRTFDRLVPMGACYSTREKLVPTREQFATSLRLARPKIRALVSLLGVSGMRIGEALTRRWSDIEVRPDGHARIFLSANETKARYARQTFVTSECIEHLQAIRKSGEFVFPGTRYERLHYQGAQRGIKEVFHNAGLVNTPGRFFTPHSLRTFASDSLRNCGLPDKYTMAIIGHIGQVFGAESHYLSWQTIEDSWVKHCSEKMQFLTASNPVEQSVLKDENKSLKELISALLARMNPPKEP